mmetsp:Transcript_45033/g.97807  ORF Transcript_45033/g.97807 Transcript_45033/m.97807 type:complete len:235 (+) Transcript_45033:1239-1943(+)
MGQQEARTGGDQPLQCAHRVRQSHVIQNVFGEHEVTALRQNLHTRQVRKVGLNEVHSRKAAEVHRQAIRHHVHPYIGEGRMILQEVPHPGHVSAACVHERRNVWETSQDLGQGINSQSRHRVPRICTSAAQGAVATHQVRGVNRSQRVELVLERNHVRLPFLSNAERGLKGQNHWQLELLEVAFHEPRMFLVACHLVIGIGALIPNSEMFVVHNAGLLHQHVLPDLATQLAPGI